MNAQPQPVVSSRNLFLRSSPKIVLARRPASRATLTNWVESGRPLTICSKEKTGIAAHSERIKLRRDIGMLLELTEGVKSRSGSRRFSLKHFPQLSFLLLFHPRAFGKRLPAAFDISFLPQRCAQHEISFRVIGAQRDGGLHLFGRLLELAALPVDDSQRVMRFWKVCVQRERALKLHLSRVELVLLLPRAAEVIVRDGRVRVAT